MTAIDPPLPPGACCDTAPCTCQEPEPQTSGPICTEAEARAAGLDIPPAPAELAAMAETIVAAAEGAPTPEVDLARAVPLMAACIERLRGALGDAADQVAERDDEIGKLSARAADLEQQAAAATEYRVPAPDGPALYVRRAPSGTGWAVFEPYGSRGRRAWTRDGWQLLAILAHSEVHCWPDATTALTEAREALTTEGRRSA